MTTMALAVFTITNVRNKARVEAKPTVLRKYTLTVAAYPPNHCEGSQLSRHRMMRLDEGKQPPSWMKPWNQTYAFITVICRYIHGECITGIAEVEALQCKAEASELRRRGKRRMLGFIKLRHRLKRFLQGIIQSRKNNEQSAGSYKFPTMGVVRKLYFHELFGNKITRIKH